MVRVCHELGLLVYFMKRNYLLRFDFPAESSAHKIFRVDRTARVQKIFRFHRTARVQKIFRVHRTARVQRTAMAHRTFRVACRRPLHPCCPS